MSTWTHTSNCTRPGDIPHEPHFAIITGSSVNIPGDERSRSCPGHGYPAHTEHYLRYVVWTNEDEWKAEIARLTLDKTPFRAIRATPAKIDVKVNVG